MISQIENPARARVSHRGERREWRFNPLWTKLESVDDDEYGLQRSRWSRADRRSRLRGMPGPRSGLVWPTG